MLLYQVIYTKIQIIYHIQYYQQINQHNLLVQDQFDRMDNEEHLWNLIE
jgi:hypothetical protein